MDSMRQVVIDEICKNARKGIVFMIYDLHSQAKSYNLVAAAVDTAKCLRPFTELSTLFEVYEYVVRRLCEDTTNHGLLAFLKDQHCEIYR